MTFILTPYVLVFAITAFISALTAGIAWARRITPGSSALALMMLGVTEWAATAGMEAASVPLAEKLFWSKAEYLGLNATPLLWLLFVLQFNGRENWLTGRRLALLSIFPAFNVLAAVTNDWHRLLWTDFAPGLAGTNLIVYHHGPLYVVLAVTTFALTMAATLFLVRNAVGPNALHRRQAGIILASAVAPWVCTVLYSLDLNPYPGLDMVPIGFMITGVILLWGFLRNQIFDLVPVARDAIMERMNDGVLVMDAQDRIVDLNPAARSLLGVAPNGIGQPVRALLERWPAIVASCHDANGCQSEIVLDAGASRYADLRISTLRDRHGLVTGRLLVIHDISQRKQTELAVQIANERLQDQLAEIKGLQAQLREEATRDVLTAMFNRRYLEETLPRELSRAARDHCPLSLLILDVDKFKQLNDKYGHEAGDVILKAVGPYLHGNIRAGDVACRYGGEEFVVVMPNTSAETAHQRADEWRTWFGQLTTAYRDVQLRGTLSGGVATFPEHGQTAAELLRAADMALYAAKAAGRNQVVTWHPGLPAQAAHTQQYGGYSS
jgi:diguanylate cyclase (GGDEF)-like protein/PAS domain S-box-containing protein